MTASLLAAAWPAERLLEALEVLARRSGLAAAAPPSGPPPAVIGGSPADPEAASRHVEAVAGWLGLEAEPVAAPYAELERLVRGAAPALVEVRNPEGGAPLYLAAARRRGRHALVCIGPDRRARLLDARAVRAALAAPHEAPLAPEVERLLDRAGVPPDRRAGARASIFREFLGATLVRSGWLLRRAAGSGRRAFAREVLLGRRIAAFLLAHAAGFALWLASWAILGRAALDGRVDAGWIAA